MEADKPSRWAEIVTVIGACVVNIVLVAYLFGKLDQRVTILEQLRVEAREETSSQLAEMRASLAELNRKMDRIIERNGR